MNNQNNQSMSKRKFQGHSFLFYFVLWVILSFFVGYNLSFWILVGFGIFNWFRKIGF